MSPIDHSNHVKPLASFSADVLVLSWHRYDKDEPIDGLTDVAPVDIAAGWGVMGKKAIRDKIKISQGNRFYKWQYSYADVSPDVAAKIGISSANWHLLPADSDVRKKILSIRKGDEVHLYGWLVEVTMTRGGVARSSLVRTDTGPGACEIIWVDRVEVS